MSERTVLTLRVQGREIAVSYDDFLALDLESEELAVDPHQIDAALERCFRWRPTAWQAYLEARRDRKTYETERDIRYASLRAAAENQIKAEREKERAAGKRSSLGQISRELVNDTMLRAFAAEVRGWEQKIEEARAREDQAKEFYEWLRDHSVALQGLARRRHEERQASGYVVE